MLFGAVKSENRGDAPMDPPRFMVDPYFWMRSDDRKDKKVLERLRQENAHCAAATGHLEGFRTVLYEELKVRLSLCAVDGRATCAFSLGFGSGGGGGGGGKRTVVITPVAVACRRAT